MKRTMITAACVAALAGCAKPAAEDFGFWQRDEAVKPVAIEVQPVRNMAAWCPRFPFARACASIDWSQTPPAGMPGRRAGPTCIIYLEASLPVTDQAEAVEHDKCHCVGFAHPTMPLGEGWRYNDPFDGARPDKCPVEVDPSIPVRWLETL